jgi:hypothetical protein
MTSLSVRSLPQEGRTGLQFFFEGAATLVLLAGTAYAARHLNLTPGTTLNTAVQLLPIVPSWMLLVVMLRHYLRIDELQRLQFLQAIAVTAAVGVGVAWSWPWLQRAFGLSMPDFAAWHIHFAILFVAASSLLTRLRNQPR